MKRGSPWILGLLLWTLLLNTAQARGTPPLEKMRAMYAAIGTSQSQIWIPYEAGLFRKYGLDVELLYIGSGSKAAQAMVAGEVPIGMFAGGAVINAGLAGADLTMVASGLNVATFFLVTRPEIKQLEDLRGKKVAVTRVGSSTDFALRFASNKWTVKPDRDFTILQAGGVPEVFMALKSGAIQAGVLNTEFTIIARKEGLRDLVDFSAIGLAFPTSALTTTRSYIRSHEDTVRKFVRGYVDGVHLAKTNKTFVVKVLKKYYRSQDEASLAEAYDIYFGRYILNVPTLSADAVKTVLDQLGEKDPRARAAKPEQFLEPRFMDELEKEGFIQRLWR